jgi:hypothetical protein
MANRRSYPLTIASLGAMEDGDYLEFKMPHVFNVRLSEAPPRNDQFANPLVHGNLDTGEIQCRWGR